MAGKNSGAKFHVLIVEDDLALASGLSRALENKETKTVSCHTLYEADALLGASHCSSERPSKLDGCREMAKPGLDMGEKGGVRSGFDLILLDVNLPDGNGFDYLQKIKQKYDIFVIMLTANDMETDIVTGLELGADDYITKPFSLAVLRARVATQLRRVETRERDNMLDAKKKMSVFAETEGWIEDGDYRFHFAKMLFYHGEEQIELSKSEQKLLHFLVENRGITLSRDKLSDCIWSVDAEFVDENTLSVTVKRLRDKLCAQDKIRTVYGIGYRWE